MGVRARSWVAAAGRLPLPDTLEFLRQQPEFSKLWSGQLVSAFGSSITALAIPLAAVLVLAASAYEVGLLAALRVLPHLLFSLFVGV